MGASASPSPPSGVKVALRPAFLTKRAEFEELSGVETILIARSAVTAIAAPDRKEASQY